MVKVFAFLYFESINFYMKKFIAALTIIFSLATGATAIALQTQESEILFAAENLFLQMKDKNYQKIWDNLTSKTKKSIIEDVYKVSRKMKIDVKKEDLANDFAFSGPHARAYWDSYLSVFDPDTVLKECVWSMGKIKGNAAEINVLHKNSERPAVLKLYKEDNAWKLGLEESFGARKLNPF